MVTLSAAIAATALSDRLKNSDPRLAGPQRAMSAMTELRNDYAASVENKRALALGSLLAATGEEEHYPMRCRSPKPKQRTGRHDGMEIVQP